MLIGPILSLCYPKSQLRVFLERKEDGIHKETVFLLLSESSLVTCLHYKVEYVYLGQHIGAAVKASDWSQGAGGGPALNLSFRHPDPCLFLGYSAIAWPQFTYLYHGIWNNCFSSDSW